VPPFFERFREEVARYAEGVHRLGPPARPPDVAGLPAELAAFLRSWNGAELFIDALIVSEAAEIEREGELVIFGRTATGDRLAIDPSRPGEPVVRLEEDTGEVLVEGTSFSRWLEGYIAAEGVIYDREGEFREHVFDDSGEELLPQASERRERKALKLDPGAPAPSWRLARALERLGRKDRAARILAELPPEFGWARFDLGRLQRDAGQLDEAEAAFATAAEADPTYEHAGYFAAHAARTAAARGDEPARARHAARALELAPGVARAQRDAAARLLEEERPADALEAAEIALAVTPRDLAARDLLARARAQLPSRPDAA
jgi:tetratricopeptide (TPR) repeat protein